MSRFNLISKCSRNWPRSLHLIIISWPCRCWYQSKTHWHPANFISCFA